MKLPEWFPVFRFKKDAKRVSPYVTALPDLPLGETRRAMVRVVVYDATISTNIPKAEGHATPSMAASMLEDGSLPDDIIRSVTGSMYLGTPFYFLLH